MPRCVILNKQVNEELNNKSGNVMRSQTVGLDLGNGHFLPFSVGLGNKPPMDAGEYDIDPKSFGLDQYGHLVLKRYVDLVPIGVKAAPTAAGK